MTPTPLKVCRSMSFASDNSEASSAEMCMEESSISASSTSFSVQSPPRSARRTSGRLLRLSAGPRFPNTPKSRRLFDEPEENATRSCASRQNLFSASRPMLRPLDLNHDLQQLNNSSDAGLGSRLFTVGSTGSAGSSGDEDSNMTTNSNSTTATTNTAAPSAYASGSRKRTSSERREIKTPKMTGSDVCYYNQNPNSSATMHYSPHISPNSFLTMDGRFVQSKNPFSSPMMMEDESYYAGGPASSSAPGPALPFSFSDGKGAMPGLLPPRLRPHDGYPQGRFSFTGSPIHEHEQKTQCLETGDTGNASCASLSKVRRFNHSDDVVAASGQHFYTARSGLSIDTLANGLFGDVENKIINGAEDLSPTDIMSFPTPPTPVKSRRRNDTGGRYQPATPRGKREQLRGLSNSGSSESTTRGSRSPHPGSILHHHQSHEDDDDDDELTLNLPKSRFYSDFDVIGELGKGSFGTVFKVLSRLDGCMYAIKEAQRKAKGAADRDRMLKEVYALAALSDQADTATFHIVRYHQAWMEDDRLYIQTELCSGTLSTEVATTAGKLTETRKYKVMREILVALDFLHRQQMVHLDIKPDNIFLKNDQYKLGDFGLVTRASCQEEIEEGDSRYMSRELLADDHSDLTKSDIFSLGATMYELCLGRPLPMNGDEWQDIRAGKLMPLPDTTHEMASLIQRMMNPDMPRRPSASDLLKHPKLLSDEQKALIEEKSKVIQANLQLAAAQQQQAAAARAASRFNFNQQSSMQAAMQSGFFPPLPVKKGLRRANTWDGRALPS